MESSGRWPGCCSWRENSSTCASRAWRSARHENAAVSSLRQNSMSTMLALCTLFLPSSSSLVQVAGRRAHNWHQSHPIERPCQHNRAACRPRTGGGLRRAGRAVETMASWWSRSSSGRQWQERPAIRFSPSPNTTLGAPDEDQAGGEEPLDGDRSGRR
jgi:hypothetical protein